MFSQFGGRGASRAGDPLSNLSEDDQRRLLLRASKERQAPGVGYDPGKRLPESQPSLVELQNQARDWLLCGILFCWFCPPVLTLLGLYEWWSARSLMGMARENRRAWLADPDPEVEQWLLEGNLRRVLRALPRSARRQRRLAEKELGHVSRHWAELHARMAVVSQMVSPTREESLRAAIASAEAKAELESDPYTHAIHRRMLDGLRGQLDDLAQMAVWRMRLQAAQDECNASLRRLHSQLTLLLAAGEVREASRVADVAAGLHDLNEHLAATHAASEEVLRLQH